MADVASALKDADTKMSKAVEVAKDAKKTVKQILDEAGTAVKAFYRFRVGQ